MIENNKQKLEKEAFELRRRYEKNLHSNGSGLNGLIVMAILSVFALMGCGERSKNSGDFKKTQSFKINRQRVIYCNFIIKIHFSPFITLCSAAS